MAQLFQNTNHIICAAQAVNFFWQPFLMLVLLVVSAFFSGSETAFFNLSPRQFKTLQKSGHKLQKLTGQLLSRPKRLLGCLLFGNMIVNVLFFAVSSVLTVSLYRQIGPAAAVLTACTSFLALVMFGEILPKSLAYINSKSISIAAAMPVFLCLQIFSPIIFIFRFLIVEPALRLILGPKKLAAPVTADEFKMLIEQSRKHGLITVDQDKLLGEIIELGFLKVRHVMQPRVDIIACDVTGSPQKARRLMLKNNLTKLPVYAGTIDDIIGMLTFRRLLLEPDKPLDKLLQKVHYVPEQKTVESLLEFFRSSSIDTAIVVDEYGQIAGSVCLEDIAEELLGPIDVSDTVKPIEQTGLLEYRLAGSLAIQDWADAFGIDPAEARISTLAGLVTAALGKIPQPGDVAHLKNLKFTVESVQNRRIKTVILTLEPIQYDN